MKINNITLENYRNIDNLTVNFDDVNIIWGENAQGKTNLVEAIYLFTGAKSFRGVKDIQLIKFGAEKSRIVFMVTGGIIFAIGYAMIEIVPAEVVSNIIFFIDTIHPLILLAIIMLFTLCIVFIALLASIQSLNKKEL